MADGTDALGVRMSILRERLAELPDLRSTVNRRHLLVDVVAISVCGVLAGADGPTAIFTWADCARDRLKKYLELPHGIPSKDRIRRVLQRLQPKAFQRCFAEWLNSLVGPAGAKFLRPARRREPRVAPPLHPGPDQATPEQKAQPHHETPHGRLEPRLPRRNLLRQTTS